MRFGCREIADDKGRIVQREAWSASRRIFPMSEISGCRRSALFRMKDSVLSSGCGKYGAEKGGRRNWKLCGRRYRHLSSKTRRPGTSLRMPPTRRTTKLVHIRAVVAGTERVIELKPRATRFLEEIQRFTGYLTEWTREISGSNTFPEPVWGIVCPAGRLPSGNRAGRAELAQGFEEERPRRATCSEPQKFVAPKAQRFRGVQRPDVT